MKLSLALRCLLQFGRFNWNLGDETFERRTVRDIGNGGGSSLRPFYGLSVGCISFGGDLMRTRLRAQSRRGRSERPQKNPLSSYCTWLLSPKNTIPRPPIGHQPYAGSKAEADAVPGLGHEPNEALWLRQATPHEASQVRLSGSSRFPSSGRLGRVQLQARLE
jgi:hypothetical protein